MKEENKNYVLWKQRLKERLKKNMSVKEWCNTYGFTKHQYYYWNRKINKKMDPEENIAFADITEKLSKPDKNKQPKTVEHHPDFKIQLNDLLITIPDNFNPESLAELMKVLQRL
ncbi:MAG: IS66 family insertion sequence element accessory protein TnpA [Saccharofermentanales bacterium]